jgi:predicted negative regulator of RcsB-dependent stress response
MKKFIQGIRLTVIILLTLILMGYTAWNMVQGNKQRAADSKPQQTQQAPKKSAVKKAVPAQDMSKQRMFEVKESDGSISVGQYPYQE